MLIQRNFDIDIREIRLSCSCDKANLLSTLRIGNFSFNIKQSILHATIDSYICLISGNIRESLSQNNLSIICTMLHHLLNANLEP